MTGVFGALIGLAALVSPPFLLYFGWATVLQRSEGAVIPPWRIALHWVAALVSSSLWLFLVFAFFNHHCDAGLGDWSCVIRWESYTRFVLRATPIFIAIAFLGRKGTRIVFALSVLATAFDFLAVDMMR